METPYAHRTSLIYYSSTDYLLRLLKALRGESPEEFRIDGQIASNIKKIYDSLLGPERSEKLSYFEDLLISQENIDSEKRDKEKYIVLGDNTPQLGFLTPQDFQMARMEDDFSLHLPGGIVDVEPISHRPRQTDNILRQSSHRHNISPDLLEVLRVYNQFVFYAIQEKPMIVALGMLNELVAKEMARRTTGNPPARGEDIDTIKHFPKSPLMQARDLLLDHYETATVVGEELVLANMGYRTDGFLPARLDKTFNTTFYKSLGSLGIFNFVASWLQMADLTFRGQPLGFMIKSLQGIQITQTQVRISLY